MGTILELVASITRVFDIMDEEVLEAAVDESDGLAHICELYRCKNGESRIPEIQIKLYKKRASSGETNGCLGKPDTHVNLTE